MGKQYTTEYRTICKSDFPGQEPICRRGDPYKVEVPPIETGFLGITLPAGISTSAGFFSWDVIITLSILFLLGPTRRMIFWPFRVVGAMERRRY